MGGWAAGELLAILLKGTGSSKAVSPAKIGMPVSAWLPAIAQVALLSSSSSPRDASQASHSLRARALSLLHEDQPTLQPPTPSRRPYPDLLPYLELPCTNKPLP